MLRKYKKILILFFSILVIGISFHFTKRIFVSNDDQTLFTLHTAINAQPPLTAIKIDNARTLLEHFTVGQIVQAEEEKSAVQEWPSNVDKAVRFKGNKLQVDASLRYYFESWFLLYPNLNFQSMRYFMARALSKKEDDERLLKLKFVQLDTLFTAYVNLVREIESLPGDDGSSAYLSNKFKTIKRLRRSYLGKETADIFFLEQEEKMYQQIFKPQEE